MLAACFGAIPAMLAIGENRHDGQSPPVWGRCPAGQRGARRGTGISRKTHHSHHPGRATTCAYYVPIPTPPRARHPGSRSEAETVRDPFRDSPTFRNGSRTSLSAFRDDARGWDDARWEGGGRPSPQPAMPRLRGDKMWRQKFFLSCQPIVFLRFGIISPTFFAGKYAPLPKRPLQSSPSLLREPDAHRVFGRAAETSPFGLGTRRPEGPRQAGGAGSAG